MHRDHETAGADDSPRPWRPNRRVLVKAAALFGALATTFGATRVVPDRATAQRPTPARHARNAGARTSRPGR